MAGLGVSSMRLPRRPSILPCFLLFVAMALIFKGWDFSFVGFNGSWCQATQRSLRGHRALGFGGDLQSLEGAQMMLAEGDSLLLGLAGAALLLAAAAVFSATSKPRADGAKEEELPPWANMVQVTQDVLSGKPFDTVLLNMRQRHGDAFRIYVPSLFGEVIVLMGLQANQFVFTEQDKNLDQALGGVVGTAVSGKKTMGTKERKSTESGKIFDKASADFFANKKALARATQIF